MTTVFVEGGGVDTAIPGTHVFIIGIGSYPHLLGGIENLVDDPMGLGQLTAPPISARALCDWFLARRLNASTKVGFNNPEVPLASVEVLLSPAGTYSLPDGTDVEVALATKANIKRGFSAWYERLKACSESIGVLYFCGHGVMVANQYLLAADFGANRLDPWSDAFDISLTLRALEREIRGPLYFFVDACRQIPRTLALSLGANPLPLLTVRLDKPVNASHLFLQASGEGALAYSRPGQVSRFTGALLQSLSGFAGRKVSGQELWAVNGDDIYRSVNQIMADDKLSAMQFPEAQITGRTTLHFETAPTRDYIELNLALWESLREARGEVAGPPAFVPPQKAKTTVIVPEKGVKVFISCADNDLQMGRRLFTDLKSKGHRPWLAKESLIPGQDWKATTSEALRTSDLFITLLSATSVARRGYFHKELREAIEILEQMPSSSIFIIPARVDKCEPPQEALRKIFWIDLFPDYDAGVERIARAIDHVYGTHSVP
jgi:TIR domain/Caspase domain